MSRRSVANVIALLGTGLLCNACCWLPALLIGVGGAAFAGLAHAFEAWRPLLWSLAAIQLAWGFRSVYRPVGHCCHVHPFGHEENHRRAVALRRMNIGVMWVVATLVVVANVVPLLMTDAAHEHAPSSFAKR